MIKSGLQNGTVTVMWEKVEKANEYRVGIVPRDAILGTGKYNGTDLEATLTGLNPTKEYKGNKSHMAHMTHKFDRLNSLQYLTLF